MIYAKRLRNDLKCDHDTSRELARLVVRNLRYMGGEAAYEAVISSIRYTQNNIDITDTVLAGKPPPMSTRFFPVVQSLI